MPHLHPQSIDHLDYRYSAEKQVFQYLKRLGDDYHVFHSLTWTSGRDGECDFIIFHEKKGFIALEVKGGRVECRERVWTSTDSGGTMHTIKDPARQARDSMHALRKLWEQRHRRDFPGCYTWGVCFLDGAWDDAFRTLDLEGRRVLDTGKLENIEQWADDLLSFTGRDGSPRIISDADAKSVLSLFNSDIAIPFSLLRAVISQQEELLNADHMQDYLLDVFEDKKRIAFQGAAGTGKTWIAMKKARRLAKGTGRVLFLCYNEQIREFIKIRMADLPGVDVLNFHYLARLVITDYIQAAVANAGCAEELYECIDAILPKPHRGKIARGGIFECIHNLGALEPGTDESYRLEPYKQKFPAGLYELLSLLVAPRDEADVYYAELIPLAVMKVFEESPGLTKKYRYGALIIDEAQDFHQNWCECLKQIVGMDDVLYIFYDDNQTIFTREKELPVASLIAESGLENHVFRLRDNLRNTDDICAFAVDRTGKGATAHPLGIRGVTPIEKTFNDEVKARHCIGEILDELVNRHGIHQERIIVLSNRNLNNSIFAGKPVAGSFQIASTGKEKEKQSVRFKTIHSFKGLESDVVILLRHRRGEDMREVYQSDELLYVGYTRAKHLLYLVNITSE